jgi:hypothetical protein
MVRRDIVGISSSPYPVPSRALLTMRLQVSDDAQNAIPD